MPKCRELHQFFKQPEIVAAAEKFSGGKAKFAIIGWR
jgi:hypothetical protein